MIKIEHKINRKSKINEKQVKQIRIEYTSRKISQKELGLKYNLDPSTISEIVNYKIWKHVI